MAKKHVVRNAPDEVYDRVVLVVFHVAASCMPEIMGLVKWHSRVIFHFCFPVCSTVLCFFLMPPREITVFIASPGDLPAERRLVRRDIRALVFTHVEIP